MGLARNVGGDRGPPKRPPIDPKIDWKTKVAPQSTPIDPKHGMCSYDLPPKLRYKSTIGGLGRLQFYIDLIVGRRPKTQSRPEWAKFNAATWEGDRRIYWVVGPILSVEPRGYGLMAQYPSPAPPWEGSRSPFQVAPGF